MPPNHTPLPILVYGAYGHTGRFIIAELINRGFTPVLSGKDRQKLAAVNSVHGGLEVRAASLDDPMALMRALAGTAAVINAAGPFAVTAGAPSSATSKGGNCRGQRCQPINATTMPRGQPARAIVTMHSGSSRRTNRCQRERRP